MRKILFLLTFITSVICTAQHVDTGFYQVFENSDGTMVKDIKSGNTIYVEAHPIFDLVEINDIESEVFDAYQGIIIAFKLNATGAEKLKNFTQSNLPTKVALVIKGNVVSIAHINMPILYGEFSLSGFDIKESKAVINALDVERGNAPMFSRGYFLIYKNKATYNGHEHYSSKTDYNTFIERESISDSECQPYYSSYYNPLSLIGDFYSYEWGYSEESACGTPNNSLGVKTIAVKTGEEISILEIVEEKVIVEAFKKDSWVVKIAEELKMDVSQIKTFEDLMNFMGDFSGIKFSPNGFCVLGYDKGLVKLRLVAQEYMGYNHNKHLQLGFVLPIKKEAITLFSDDANFYLGKYENGLTK